MNFEKRKKQSKIANLVALAILSVIIIVSFAISAYVLSPKRIREIYVSNEASMHQNEGFITVGVSQVGSESVWRSANTASVKKALSRENGFFLRFSNARQKQENQIKTVREFISQEVDAIVIAPVTAYGWDTVLNEAKDAGIPVIFMDRLIETEDDSLYSAFVGTDMFDEGYRAGCWLEENLKLKSIEALARAAEEDSEEDSASETEQFDVAADFEDIIEPQNVNIVILKGTEGSTAQIDRSAGFASVAQEHPEWNILAEVDADFTTTKAEEVMNELLAEYDNIDIVVSQNDDMTFGAINALDKKGITHGPDGDVTIISFDAVREALILVRDGKIDVDIECNPAQGDVLSWVVRAVVNGNSYEKKNYIQDNIFTKDNVNAYINTRLY